MKLPAIPKIPKMPKFSKEDLREKLPFQPRREFVMSDSEHPVDAAAMEYRPSTGYVAPQPAVQSAPQAPQYRDIDHEMPFRQEMVYPGGGARVPYAAGGQARSEYAGSWPPPPAHAQPVQEPIQAPAAPQPQAVPPAFAQAEYYVPRHQPNAQYAQPYYAYQQPYGYPAPGTYPQQPQQTPAPGAAAPRQAQPMKKTSAKGNQPGLAVRLAAVAGALLPKAGVKDKSRSAAAPRQAQSSPTNATVNGYQPSRQPNAPTVMGPVERRYFVWSASIVAGLVLTVISFIYACAA